MFKNARSLRPMILVFSPRITNRVRYTFRAIFEDILLVPVSFTSVVEEYLNFNGPKICYANHPLEGGMFFQSRHLLSETGLKDQNITVFNYNGLPAFYSTSRTSVIPFDPFSATFYLLSRYEEYMPSIRDPHDRYEANQSIGWASGFLQRPVVNLWAQLIKELILQKYPEYKFPERKYKFVSTIDIDNAFAYREKGFVRVTGGFLRSLTRLDFKELSERARVLLGFERDPYDTYEYLFDIQDKYNVRSIYFFLLADYGLNDKNVPVTSRKFRSLIKAIGDRAEVGIHPGYGSTDNPKKLETEIRRLSKILNREITKSRQHFLRLQLPNTYRNLIDLDITDDFTMGYASEIGFRAGCCTAFNFYDLDLEIETKLRIHPFAVMEATLKYYMKLTPEASLEKVKALIEEVRKVNGTFMTLWHNETLSDTKQWKGWKDLYEQVVIAAKE